SSTEAGPDGAPHVRSRFPPPSVLSRGDARALRSAPPEPIVPPTQPGLRCHLLGLCTAAHPGTPPPIADVRLKGQPLRRPFTAQRSPASAGLAGAAVERDVGRRVVCDVVTRNVRDRRGGGARRSGLR